MDKTQNNLELRNLLNDFFQDIDHDAIIGDNIANHIVDVHLAKIQKYINSQIKQSNEEITFDATGAYWEGEEHGWLLVAIQNGKVIWDEKHLAEDISNVVYSETGEYTGDVIRQRDTEIAAKYYFEQYKSKESEGE